MYKSCTSLFRSRLFQTFQDRLVSGKMQLNQMQTVLFNAPVHRAQLPDTAIRQCGVPWSTRTRGSQV